MRFGIQLLGYEKLYSRLLMHMSVLLFIIHLLHVMEQYAIITTYADICILILFPKETFLQLWCLLVVLSFRMFPSLVWTVRDFTLELIQDGHRITSDEYLECSLLDILGIVHTFGISTNLANHIVSIRELCTLMI